MDASSSLESAPGINDHDRIDAFAAAVAAAGEQLAEQDADREGTPA